MWGGLQPSSKADHLFTPLHLVGWHGVGDRHGPAGGGMKGLRGWCWAPGGPHVCANSLYAHVVW